jgi:hypothetical protein
MLFGALVEVGRVRYEKALLIISTALFHDLETPLWRCVKQNGRFHSGTSQGSFHDEESFTGQDAVTTELERNSFMEPRE